MTRRPRTHLLAALGILALAAGPSGCGSIMARGYMAPDFPEREPPPYFYRGVAAHFEKFGERASSESAFLLPLAFVTTALDVALCLVVDTLLTPVDFFV